MPDISSDIAATSRSGPAPVDRNESVDERRSTAQADRQSASQPDQGQTLPSSGKVQPGSQSSQPKFDLSTLAQRLEEFARRIDRVLQFRVDEASGRMIITVLDPETKEVIRQIPPEEMLHVAAQLEKSKAILFDAIV